jgi:hypothetical protein
MFGNSIISPEENDDLPKPIEDAKMIKPKQDGAVGSCISEKKPTIIPKKYDDKARSGNSTRKNILYFLLITVIVYLIQRLQLFPRFYGLFSQSTLHDQPVDLFSIESDCRGSSFQKRQVCDLKGTTYFLKKISFLGQSNHEVSSQPDKSGLISYEEFNRQFVKENIGALVPKTSFFKIPSLLGQPKFYIGSEIVEGLQHAISMEDALEKLGKERFAMLTVALMFIEDLHIGNWGYNQQGFYLIDVDSNDKIPKNINDFLMIAHVGLRADNFKISLDNLMDIKNLLTRMKHLSLPKFHESFYLTTDLYLDLINIYIRSCEKTISYITKVYPDLESNKLSREVSSYLSERVFLSQYELGPKDVKESVQSLLM